MVKQLVLDVVEQLMLDVVVSLMRMTQLLLSFCSVSREFSSRKYCFFFTGSHFRTLRTVRLYVYSLLPWQNVGRVFKAHQQNATLPILRPSCTS